MKTKSTAKVSTSRKLLFTISDEQKEEIKEAFDVLDTDKTNTIAMRDLSLLFRALGFEVTSEEIKKIQKESGKGEEDVLKYEEFFDIMQKKFVNFL